MSSHDIAGDNREPYWRPIVVLSVVIPFTVAALFMVRIPGYDLSFLPPIYATVNGITSVVLVVAVVAIRQGQRTIHERLMKSAVVLSGCFLIMYIAYHITSDPTPYGGEGALKYIYYFILVTHILLSIVIVPFVLFTFARGLSGNLSRHKALARYTFPMWLYVTATGVIVYLMISPYYK